LKLIDILKKHESSVRLHTPGHKGRNLYGAAQDIYSCDMTELSDTDNLYNSKGILKQIRSSASQIYNTHDCRLLINGTTSGILSSVCACFKPGDKVLIQRNSHLSVYHAAMLAGIDIVYAYGEDGLYYEAHTLKVNDVCGHNNLKGVIITYPAYTGTCADIETILNHTKQRGITSIVDEAHGAHLAFSSAYPAAAEHCGADIVVQSTHKMLSSLTQSSLMHICSNNVDTDWLDFYLRVYQSSSPSYILMNSLQQALLYAVNNAKTVFDNLIHYRVELKSMLSDTPYRIMDDVLYDWSKVWINVKGSGYTGFETAKMLEEKNIFIEYASFDYILALLGIGTKESDIIALASGLKNIKTNKSTFGRPNIAMPKTKAALNIKDAVLQKYEFVDYTKAKNKISADFVLPYPPGIPLLVPGEIISEDIINAIKQYNIYNTDIMGIKENKIKVVK